MNGGQTRSSELLSIRNVKRQRHKVSKTVNEHDCWSEIKENQRGERHEVKTKASHLEVRH